MRKPLSLSEAFHCRNKLYIDVHYQVKAGNDKRNLVFPFYSIPEDGSDY